MARHLTQLLGLLGCVPLPRLGAAHSLLPLAQLLVLETRLVPGDHDSCEVLEVDHKAKPIEQRHDGELDLTYRTCNERLGLLPLGVAVQLPVDHDVEQLCARPQLGVRVRK